MHKTKTLLGSEVKGTGHVCTAFILAPSPARHGTRGLVMPSFFLAGRPCFTWPGCVGLSLFFLPRLFVCSVV